MSESHFHIKDSEEVPSSCTLHRNPSTEAGWPSRFSMRYKGASDSISNTTTRSHPLPRTWASLIVNERQSCCSMEGPSLVDDSEHNVNIVNLLSPLPPSAFKLQTNLFKLNNEQPVARRSLAGWVAHDIEATGKLAYSGSTLNSRG